MHLGVGGVLGEDRIEVADPHVAVSLDLTAGRCLHLLEILHFTQNLAVISSHRSLYLRILKYTR